MAGFAATLVLTAVMVVKLFTRFVPEINLAALLSGAMHAQPWVGWGVHFVIGTFVWGPLFALVVRPIPGSTCTVRGILFSVGAWLVMQLVVLPLAGMGVFGVAYGFMAPAVTLALHMIYGAVLGATYAWVKGDWRPPHVEDGAHGALRYTHY
jgi:hypothetical protein